MLRMPNESVLEMLWRLSFVSVSRIGEKINCEPMIYNWAVTRGFHKGALEAAPKFAKAVTELFPTVKTVADVGCGTGVFSLRFNELGLKATACEYSPRGRRWARAQGVTCHEFDVSKDDSGMPGGPYDLAFSLEVAEHVPAALAQQFVNYLAGSSSLVVFTAAFPGQGGIGHINEQPQQYWISRFEARGFRHDREMSATLAQRLRELGSPHYHSTNMMVFRKAA
jgi:SAM-dependent methyltransferase